MKLHGLARFQSTLRNARLLFSGESVDFRNVALSAREKLSFHNCDLREASFLGTDVSAARFTAVEWPRKRGKIVATNDELSELPSRRSVLTWLSEFLSTEITSIPQFLLNHISRVNKERQRIRREGLQALYRDIKHNQTSQGAYASGGDFHIAEKNMRRKSRSNGIIDRITLTIYSVVSGYGERYLRTLIWIVACIGTSAYIYDSMLQIGWKQASLHSFLVFFNTRPKYLVALPSDGTLTYYHLVYWFETILGIALIALFLFALRQRMKR
jgi:hypothetical protein